VGLYLIVFALILCVFEVNQLRSVQLNYHFNAPHVISVVDSLNYLLVM
jgi:uncharacterized integral membrane protein